MRGSEGHSRASDGIPLHIATHTYQGGRRALPRPGPRPRCHTVVRAALLHCCKAASLRSCSTIERPEARLPFHIRKCLSLYIGKHVTTRGPIEAPQRPSALYRHECTRSSPDYQPGAEGSAQGYVRIEEHGVCGYARRQCRSGISILLCVLVLTLAYVRTCYAPPSIHSFPRHIGRYIIAKRLM